MGLDRATGSLEPLFALGRVQHLKEQGSLLQNSVTIRALDRSEHNIESIARGGGAAGGRTKV